jgi:hypothetical protein
MKPLEPHILEVLNCDFTKQKMRNQSISRGIINFVIGFTPLKLGDVIIYWTHNNFLDK